MRSEADIPPRSSYTKVQTLYCSEIPRAPQGASRQDHTEGDEQAQDVLFRNFHNKSFLSIAMIEI